MKKYALISVSDKTGIVEAAKRLCAIGYEIISTGGTAAALQNAGIKVVGISEITGFPECLDGRVKTLHPAVHAGLLAVRDNPDHMKQLTELNINAIDVVIVNLYPFKQTIMKPGVEFADAVENIDIGGPTMLRSAAKNYQDVAVIVDPADYEVVFAEMENGEVSLKTRERLMYKVFAHTSLYDTLIANYLRQRLGVDFPPSLTLAFEKREDLRYGENPHQKAAVYSDAVGSITFAEQLNGKQLSYNNLNDANGAVELLKEFTSPTVVAVKHANPCGVATAEDVCTAYKKAHDSDPVSIFGGIVAVNGTVDKAAAQEMVKTFLEVVIAPDYTDDALEVLRTKENLRVLKNPGVKASGMEFKKLNGGLLLQESDGTVVSEMKTVTKAQPTEAQKTDMEFGMKVVKHCKSNAIVIVKDDVTLGLGIGQTNRIWAVKQAAEHCLGGCKGAVLASDAFFPFGDCVKEAAAHGIAAIVQPGGSVRDEESVIECDKHGIVMVFTGQRHFKH